MFLAALTSRSCTVPHAPHRHWRTASGLGPSRIPHAEQSWLVASNRPTLRNWRPYSRALYVCADFEVEVEEFSDESNYVRFHHRPEGRRTRG
jgi:hypothetical protein